MAITANREPTCRWRFVLTAPARFADEMSFIGTDVGPRRGPFARTHGEKEDWCLRRLLTAWRYTGRLAYPVEIIAELQSPSVPDYVFRFGDGLRLGLEVTEATEPDFQAWLSRTDDQDSVLFPGEGHVDDEPERQATQRILDAVARKSEALRAGKYSEAPVCDLLIYDNSETGWMSDNEKVLSLIRSRQPNSAPFRQVHLIQTERVILDLFGNSRYNCDLSEVYEIDFDRWTRKQGQLLRSGMLTDIDPANLAEEIEGLGRRDKRALQSQLIILLLHLIKWRYQPQRRGNSWRQSIRNARREVLDTLSDSPSLRGDLAILVSKTYRTAWRDALEETDNVTGLAPKTCPFTLEQLLDEDYWPEEDQADD